MMKKRNHKIISIFMVLVLLITMTAASAIPVYAGGSEPGINYQSSDMWLWPNQVASTYIYLDRGVDSVNLQFYSPFYNDWTWFSSCTSKDPDNDSWEAQVSKEHWEDDYITLRFEIIYDGGYVMHSPEFRIEWSSFISYERVYGDNRYETARAIADQTRLMKGGVFSKYPAVIIASGKNFADALGGSYLSSVYAAPILLVSDNPNVISATTQEIMSNMYFDGPIFILGGTGAVPGDMEISLASAGFSNSQIIRFDGANRYDTNLKVLNFCFQHLGELIVCSGTSFADALSASAACRPIMLVGKQLTANQKNMIYGLEPRHVYLAGGTGAVNETVENEIRGMVADDYTRFAGNDRYETSALIATKFFGDRQRFFVTFAYGKSFPDGLSGGGLAISLGAPLLLIDDKHYEKAELAVEELGCRSGFVFGGPTLIADETVDRIMHRSDLGQG